MCAVTVTYLCDHLLFSVICASAFSLHSPNPLFLSNSCRLLLLHSVSFLPSASPPLTSLFLHPPSTSSLPSSHPPPKVNREPWNSPSSHRLTHHWFVLCLLQGVLYSKRIISRRSDTEQYTCTVYIFPVSQSYTHKPASSEYLFLSTQCQLHVKGHEWIQWCARKTKSFASHRCDRISSLLLLTLNLTTNCDKTNTLHR